MPNMERTLHCGDVRRYAKYLATRCQIRRALTQTLAALSDDALKDIGLNRGDVEQDRHLHFWQDPLRK